MKVIRIPADLTKSLEEDDIEKGWQSMAAEVDGFIQRVRIGDHTKDPSVRFEDAVLIVDEEGGPNLKRKPVNFRASLLYGFIKHNQYIYGDALLVGEGFVFDTDEGPGTDFIDLPKDKPLTFWQQLIDEMATAVNRA